MDDRVQKAQQAQAQGGLLIEEIGDNIKVHLAIDPKNPLLIFDRLNEFEVDMVKRANNDPVKVAAAGAFVDDIRQRTKKMLKQAGVDIDALSL